MFRLPAAGTSATEQHVPSVRELQKKRIETRDACDALEVIVTNATREASAVRVMDREGRCSNWRQLGTAAEQTHLGNRFQLCEMPRLAQYGTVQLR